MRTIRDAIAVWRLCAAAEYCLAKAATGDTPYLGVVVADILKAAGMSRRSYYVYFDSSGELIERMHVAARCDPGAVLGNLVPSCEHVYAASGPAISAASCIAHAVIVSTWESPRAAPIAENFMLDGQPGGLFYDWACAVLGVSELHAKRPKGDV